MKLFSLIAILTAAFLSEANARTVREVIYKGKIDTNVLKASMLVSSFYQVDLQKDKNPSFEYKLKSGISNSKLSAGIYQATSFSLAPSINSKLAMALRVDFTQRGPIRVSGEKGQFDGELYIEGTKIGSARYEFDMYALPIRKVYNPKVKQQLEPSGDGFEVVEIREIP